MMNTSKDSPNNIDQIRQLIFGDQIQDYDRRFQELSNKVSRIDQQVSENKAEIDEKLQTLERHLEKLLTEHQKTIQKELDSRLKTIQQELNQKILNLADDKIDRGQLADQLIDLAMRLKGSTILDQMEKEISNIA